MIVAAAAIATATKLRVQATARAAQIPPRTRMNLGVQARTLGLVPRKSLLEEQTITLRLLFSRTAQIPPRTRMNMRLVPRMSLLEVQAAAVAEGCNDPAEDEDEPRGAGIDAEATAAAAAVGCTGSTGDAENGSEESSSGPIDEP
jgi:hypothetical protein